MAKQFKYAINTNAFRDKWSVPEIVQLCKKIGIDGIEWGLPPIDNAKYVIDQMHQLTTDAGLEVVGYINAGHLWKTDLMKQYSELLASVDGKMLRVSPPWVAFEYKESLHQKDTYAQLTKLCRDGLEKLVPLGKTYDIKYVVEMHMGTVCPSAESARSLMEGLDSRYVGVIYDPANGVFEGFTRPRFALEVLGPYCAYVHAKNIILPYVGDQPEEPRRAAWEFKSCSLESGMVDFVEVFFAMKVNGYSGWISMEEFFAKAPEFEIARAVAFMKECDRLSPSAPREPFTAFNQ
jgi:sugar phosphate isomerase/epimerase